MRMLRAALCFFAAVSWSFGESKSVENGLGMRLVSVPPGRFQMGSDVDEKGHQDDERRHEVILSQQIFMSATEVTQSQFEEIMGWNRSVFDGENHPVEGVSWKDAQTFCQKLSERESKKYRLPTEAEWEYACRAGSSCESTTREDLEARAWFSDNSGGRTHEVGGKEPNAWGLYDMLGNVAEWCLDDYVPEVPEGILTDPLMEKEGAHKVVRGGSWDYFPLGCRCAARSHRPSSHPHKTVGFRVILEP